MKKGGLGPWKNVDKEKIGNVVLKHTQGNGCMRTVYVVSMSVQKPAVERSGGTLTITLFPLKFKCFFSVELNCLTSALALASYLNFSMAWSIKTVCMYRQQKH
jgi:hypothetical protein